MSAQVAIIVFPGSNCELDVFRATKRLGAEPRLVWHSETDIGSPDVIVIPGGFAHGDYLRTGALARFSPAMGAVQRHADDGGIVIGICNGFQILCEAGLLPGALRKNAGLKFLCRWTDLRVERADTPFTSGLRTGDVLRIPINHFEGNWYCDPDDLEAIRSRGQIVFRYIDNPNGALDDVAGILNEHANVLGMMPHPERASESAIGSDDGNLIWRSVLEHVGAGALI